jgi:hypothetical protein
LESPIFSSLQQNLSNAFLLVLQSGHLLESLCLFWFTFVVVNMLLLESKHCSTLEFEPSHSPSRGNLFDDSSLFLFTGDFSFGKTNSFLLIGFVWSRIWSNNFFSPKMQYFIEWLQSHYKCNYMIACAKWVSHELIKHDLMTCNWLSQSIDKRNKEFISYEKHFKRTICQLITEMLTDYCY